MSTHKEIATLSDEALARHFQQTTDSVLYTKLVTRHQAHIQKSCYRWLKNREDAQDVSQEVLLRVYTQIGTYRHEAPFSAWLRTIIRNRCVDHLRRDKKRMHQEISQKITENLAEELNTDGLETPLEEKLAGWLERFSGQEKTLLVLKYCGNWSYREIQQALGLTEGAAKIKLSRTKAKLQKLLEQQVA